MRTQNGGVAVGGRTSFSGLVTGLACLVGAVLLAGCGMMGPSITGSGHPATKEYQFADFSQVKAGSAFQIEVVQGAKYQVTVTIDDNLLDKLDVAKSGDTLSIGLQPYISIRQATMRAKVVMPTLTGLDLSGAARGEVSGFSSDKKLKVELSGASHLRADVVSGDATFDASGASHAEVHGKGKTLKAMASGASHLDLDGFASGDASIEASGASHVVVNASGALNASASGASSVRYTGKPASVNSSASGASSVKER